MKITLRTLKSILNDIEDEGLFEEPVYIESVNGMGAHVFGPVSVGTPHGEGSYVSTGPYFTLPFAKRDDNSEASR